MSNVERLSISLSQEMAEMVRGAVKAGEYTSSSEVVREALRDWKRKQTTREANIDRLKEAWAKGIEDIENGRSTTIQTEEDARVFVEGIKKTGREKLATLRTK